MANQRATQVQQKTADRPTPPKTFSHFFIERFDRTVNRALRFIKPP